MKRGVHSVFVFLLFAASGCFGSGNGLEDSPEDRLGNEPRVPAVVPPGCEASRPAIVHGPNGDPASGFDGPLPVPCLLTTSWRGYEPTVGIDAAGAVFLYPAWPDEPLSEDILDRFNGMGVARSLDEGASWTRQTSMIGPANWHPFTADPFMYVDPMTGRVFMEDLIIPPFNCSNFSFSDDQGETWTQTLGGCMEWDHVSIFAGIPVSSSPDGYPNVVYRCAIQLVATTVASTATACQKSLDGGMIWQPPGEPAFLFGESGPYVPSTCHGAAHHGIVDHRGWVWLGRTWCPDPYVAISKDEGATWERHEIADASVGAVWHDVAIDVDPSGTAYAAWLDKDAQPVLAVSHDDGVTWSEPFFIGIPGLETAGLIALDAGGVGKVAIEYGAHLSEDSPAVHGVITMAFGADGPEPIFVSSVIDPPGDPLGSGSCAGTCSGLNDFITLHIGPDGTPWGALINGDLLAVGRLWGGPSLWDEDDANGPFP